MEQVFRKRPGTTDVGKDYEVLTVANIAMALTTDDKIKDFHISSNDDDFGAFDDVIIETQQDTGTRIYALQLKHSDRGNLSSSHLVHPKGDFSIKKYFTSWQTIKIAHVQFVLYTNLRFKVKEGTEMRLDGEDFLITPIRISSKHQISQKTDYCYKFCIINDDNSNRNLLYQKFFDSFFLYPDQENMYNLKRHVSEKFKHYFHANDVECNEYVKFLNEWNLQDGRKEKLNKKWIQLVIALKIFASRIKPLSFGHVIDHKDHKYVKRNVLREAIRVFGVSIFKTESYHGVSKLWGDATCELKDLKTINKLRTKYQIDSSYISDIAEVNPYTLSIILWLMGKCPLILTQDASVQRAVELCVGEKFIILKDDSVESFPKNIDTFETLSDLKAKTFEYDQIVKNLTCSLQGKEEIFLRHLISVNEDILNVIKTDDLLEMFETRCCIAQAKETLSQPYIERCLLKHAIDIKILDDVTEETVVILDCVSQKKYSKVFNKYLGAEMHHRLSTDHSFDKKSHTVFVSETRCELDEFNAVCNKFKSTRNFHQFRVRNDQNLEWIRSKSDVSDVEKYKLSQYYSVPERDLDSSEFQNINLLISDPGMGKSELMKSFKIKCFSDRFTVIIDPKDVYSFLTNTNNDENYVHTFQKFLLNEKSKTLSQRDYEIFMIFSNKNKIIYVWDALDELSDQHREIVADIIVDLSKTCVQWATSRCHLQNTLQNKFNVLCLNLNKFNEHEQNIYIERRLSGVVSSVETMEIIKEKIKSSFALVEHKDILGIPLQIFILTELFPLDQKKYLALLNNTFLLTDLYNYFIQDKIDIHFRQRLGIDLNTASAHLLIQSEKNKLLEEYTNAGLKLLFPETILNELDVEYEQSSRLIQENHKNIGLVTHVTDQIPRFVHNSFAEYLTACYFAKNHRHKAILLRIMFDPKYNNVRFFFDLLLAAHSGAHIAVLYRNFNFIKSCDGEVLKIVDSGGRSVLHLACSWGQRYAELKVKHVRGKYTVYDTGMFSTVPDTKQYLETIDYLLNKCDLYKSDQIYNLTPGGYARKTASLGVEMMITMKERKIIKSIDLNHIINILFYSAYYGYSDEFTFYFELFFQIKRVSFVEFFNKRKRRRNMVANIINNTGMSLLHIAARMGRIKIVELLVRAGADINLGHEDGLTPLSIASDMGHDEIAEFLLKMGADINLSHKDGFTPLHVASHNGHDKIAEFLVKTGADVNSLNKNGAAALHIAAHNGYGRIVDVLIQAGADVNLPNKSGSTALYIAAHKGYDGIVESLIKADADVNVAHRDGTTPLHVASYNGFDEIVESLIKADADVNLVNKIGNTSLYVASERGHVKIVELLEKVGADVNLVNKNSVTPLYIASQNGHDSIVKLLVEAGADPNLVHKNGLTPLAIASDIGYEKTVEFLLKVGANTNLAHKDGFTPLYVASRSGHDRIVGLLVDAGPGVNHVNKNGATAVYVASQQRHVKIVELLVRAGADVNIAQKDGFTPLCVAAHNGDEQIAVLLVETGADINLANKNRVTPVYIASQNGHDKIVEFLVTAGANINLANKNSVTPLYIAAQNGHKKIVEFLLRANTDNNIDDRDGFTLLHVASYNGYDKIVEFLVEEGADTNLADNDGRTSLYMASQKGHDKIVEFLVQTGADVHVANKNGATPLYVASEQGHLKIVAFLVKAGAQINTAHKNGSTPLYISCEMGHDKTVEFLVKAGADMHLADKDGFTPLYTASQNGRDRIVEFLVEAGADVNLANRLGWTPLIIASAKGRGQIVEFLVAAGADVNLANENGVTPIFMASQNGHDGIIELLLEAGADVNLARKDGYTPRDIAASRGSAVFYRTYDFK